LLVAARLDADAAGFTALLGDPSLGAFCNEDCVEELDADGSLPVAAMLDADAAGFAALLGDPSLGAFCSFGWWSAGNVVPVVLLGRPRLPNVGSKKAMATINGQVEHSTWQHIEDNVLHISE
jgi:hypothetical protein